MSDQEKYQEMFWDESLIELWGKDIINSKSHPLKSALNVFIAQKKEEAGDKQIFARLGFSDVIVPIEEADEKPDVDTVLNGIYTVGYELEDGTECNEDGSPLEK